VNNEDNDMEGREVTGHASRLKGWLSNPPNVSQRGLGPLQNRRAKLAARVLIAVDVGALIPDRIERMRAGKAA
jgi:hypothetical protein